MRLQIRKFVAAAIVAICACLITKEIYCADEPEVTNPKPDQSLIVDRPKADQPAGEKSSKENAKAEQSFVEGPPRKSPADPSVTLKQLGDNVWIDSKNKQVIVDGQICLNKGMLEMFAVPKGTKEHESIVSVNTKAQVVHAALLAVGAVPGTTVRFQPKYTPATGPKVDVFVYWVDEQGKQQKAKAQDWIRDIKTKKAMEYPWVFGGSGFYVDPETKKSYYLAEVGDFICVSNFPDAMMDLPVESTDSNDDLEYEAFTERIPARGTKVTLVLAPQIEKKSGTEKSGK